jgi:hypothetical protein
MVDIHKKWTEPAPADMHVKYRDAENGTHAEVVAIGHVDGYAGRATWSGDTAQTDELLWQPASGKALCISLILVSASDTQTIELEVAGTSEDIMPPIYLAANGGAVLPFPGGGHQLAVNQGIALTSTANVAHSIAVYGREV